MELSHEYENGLKSENNKKKGMLLKGITLDKAIKKTDNGIEVDKKVVSWDKETLEAMLKYKGVKLVDTPQKIKIEKTSKKISDDIVSHLQRQAENDFDQRSPKVIPSQDNIKITF